MKVFVFSLFSLTSALCWASYSVPEAAEEQSRHSYVNLGEGIPVFSGTNSEEVCGWLPFGTYVETQSSDSPDFLKLKRNHEACPGAAQVYIQKGFLTEARFAGPVSRSRTNGWKAEILDFSTPCVERDQGNKIIVSFVGDVLLHGGLQLQGQERGFSSLWEKVIPVFQNADLAYANLEGPVAENIDCRGRSERGVTIGRRCSESSSYVYTSYPMFNYHPSLIPALKSSGFDVVSTANNHSLDRFSVGVDKTIEGLLEEDLLFTGTRRSDHQDSYYTVSEVRSQGGEVFKIAWLACTFSTNGMPDRNGQVLDCFRSNGRSNPDVLDLVSQLKAQPEIDGVIVTPHWGPTEYVHTVHPSQLRMAKDLIEAGASAVVGAHPHVLQPWEKYVAADGREGFIHYSLGNFVSGQTSIAKRASMILLVGFQKNNQGQLVVDGVRYIPAYMMRHSYTNSTFTPLDRGTRMSSEGSASLNKILSLFPSELRLDSHENLTTCR